jgi:hypothetical protein
MSKMPYINPRDAEVETARAILKLDLDYIPVGDKKVVGGFGVINDDGYSNIIHWVVNPRRDTRYGVVDTPAQKDEYAEELFEAMFRNW